MWQAALDLTAGADPSAVATGLAGAPAAVAGAPAAAAPAAAAAPVAGSLSPWQLILDAGPVVKGVMLLLLAASFVCWAIIVAKAVLLVVARARSRFFLRDLERGDAEDAAAAAARAAGHSPHARLYLAARREVEARPGGAGGEAEEGPVKRVERTLGRSVDLEITRLESWLGWLATIGSTAPFVGLFGTVWGIMSSFINIGAQQSATLAVVAPGIAEALIATAVGLVAAIPSVVAYNLFVRRIRVWHEDLSAFAAQLVNDEDARRRGDTPGESGFTVGGTS